MKRHRNGRRSSLGRRVGKLLGLSLVALLAVGALAGPPAYRAHMRFATGRDDVRLSCLYCHRKVEAPAVGFAADGPRYIDPIALAVSTDGERLFVAGRRSNQLLEVDLTLRAVTRTVELGAGPQDLCLSRDGRRLAVTCRDADEVVVLDAEELSVVGRVPTAPEPTGVWIDAAGGRLFWAEAGGTLAFAASGDDTSPRRLSMGTEPDALELSADGSLLVVAHRRARPVHPGEVPVAELTLVDATRGRVRERRLLESAHLSEDVALTSEGAWALAPVVHVRNLLPITQVRRGAVMSTALVLAETRPGGRTAQLPLDEANAYFADPVDVVVTPDDAIAFVAHQGANVVTALDLAAMRELVLRTPLEELAGLPDRLDLSADYVLARIPTGIAPGALALAPDGGRLYVAERLEDSVAVVDVASLEVLERIDLGGPEVLTPERAGERVFHDAAGTFQGQFACASCHPDGHTDGLIWDFEIDGVGKNLLETRSLRGIADTPPFKWNGKNPDLQTQCGPRFARVLMRSEPFTPERLEQLVAYIESIPLRSRRIRDEDAPARERGRALFFRATDNRGRTIPVSNRCGTCHRPPLYTNRLKTDVGTDGSFDTPHLIDLAASGPYLHDGRALTLEEIWTVHSPHDTHGVTNDLSKVELNDLMTFLRSL